jgi:WD40 repeat protein
MAMTTRTALARRVLTLVLCLLALVLPACDLIVVQEDTQSTTIEMGAATAPSEPSPEPSATPPAAVTETLAPITSALPPTPVQVVTNTPAPLTVTPSASATPTSQPPSTPTASEPSGNLNVTQAALLEDIRVKQLAWSPDGSLLAIGTYHVLIYDGQKLEQLYVIDTVQWANSIVFAPGGTLLATASHDGIKLWEVGGWGEIRTLAASQDAQYLAFSPDGALLAAGIGRVVKLWEVATGDELRTLPAQGYGRADRVLFSPDGGSLVAGGAGSITVWDTAVWSETQVLETPANTLNAMVLAPDGQTLATAYVNSDMVDLWDVSRGRRKGGFGGHAAQVASLAFSPDGRLLAAASGVEVKLWDVSSGVELRTLRGHSDQVTSVAFAPDGTRLVTGATDVRLWALEWGAGAPEPTPTLELSAPIRTTVPLSGRAITPENAEQVIQRAQLDSDWTRQLLWSPDGNLLAVCTYHIYFYDAQSLEQVYVIDSVQWPNGIAFSPDGTLFAAAVSEGVKLWEVGSWGELRTLSGSRDTESVAFSPDGRLLASATGSIVKLWDVATGDDLRTLPAGSVTSVAFSPDGGLLAAAAGVAGQEIKLWDVVSGVELRTLKGHTNWIHSVVFAPDGETLASGAVDDTVRLWDVDSGRQLRVFGGHTDQVESVAFSPDGRLLASASWDLTVKLWDVANGEELRTLVGHTEWLTSVDFAPDGATLASGANDTIVRLWGVGP